MNNSILYFECNSGISGDMTVGALLDLGADPKVLKETLASLPLSGYQIEISEVYKSGLKACDFNVILDKDNHDHDMEYLHGCSSQAEHVHRGQGNEEHPHEEHSHEGHHHEGHHHHHADARNLRDITEILQKGALTPNALNLALRMFTILAEAEAKVHGKSIDTIHFHEVGAVDSIVDIAAVAICIDNLHPDQVVFSALSDGMGQIRCQHGIIPVPVPAVSAIAAAHQLTLKIRPIEGELVTPTGAAIAAALDTGAKLPEEFTIMKIGLGAAKRDYPTTQVLRAMLLQPVKKEEQDTVLMLQTNLDDCTGEALSYTMEQLLQAGALDVYFTPVYMKKNRPATLLSLLCAETDRQKMEEILFRNTTTIGIRYQSMQRTKLDRRIQTIDTAWGKAQVKICTYQGIDYCYPENDSVKELALANGIGFNEMYHLLKETAAASL